MNVNRARQPAILSWLFVGALLVLCGILGLLQYRWIGELSLAARDRLRASLQANLIRLSQDFNAEITSECLALLPSDDLFEREKVEREFALRYERWRTTTRHGAIFRAFAIALPADNSVDLRIFNPLTANFENAPWPERWAGIQRRLEFTLSPEHRNRPGPPPPQPGEETVLRMPLMANAPPGRRPGFFGRRQAAWFIFDLNPSYLKETLLPELLHRHLGSTHGELDYQVEIMSRNALRSIIYESHPGPKGVVAGAADASISLFGFDYQQMFRRAAPPRGRAASPGPPRPRGTNGTREPPPSPGPGPGGPGFGHWQLFVRHRAGSLDAVVEQSRRLNFAVTGGVLILMLVTAAALIRFTRRAQKLAELQIGFVTGVSHELRTPLTVIHTAAYNLRGAVAHNPAQVERYGSLIQRESGRLKELVEEVLRFGAVKAGRVIQTVEPLRIEEVIDAALQSSKTAIQAAACTVEKDIGSALPPIMGDPLALRQALENLLSNALKYGTAGNRWIGIFACEVHDGGPAAVEIRISDHGPGIPEDEQDQIFEPFFRGRRAVEGQVHGTGLGLSLVKKIVEAHGGSIQVRSEPPKGTDFIVRIPAEPAAQGELTAAYGENR